MQRLTRLLIAFVALVTGLNVAGDTAYARMSQTASFAQTQASQSGAETALTRSAILTWQASPVSNRNRTPAPKPSDPSEVRIPTVQLGDRARE